jgi:hypothetical protein
MLVSVENRRQPGSGRGKGKQGGARRVAQGYPLPHTAQASAMPTRFSIRSKRVETGFDLASFPHTARYRDNAPAK